MPRLFCFGLGYSASRLTERLDVEGWEVAGTTATPAGAQRAARGGFRTLLLNDQHADPQITEEINAATHLLASIPPGALGDPALARYAEAIVSAPLLQWIGYLSTVGVYGDRGGDWVDETTPVHPISERSIRRVSAESAWGEIGQRRGTRVAIFRLPGIYGPGRSAIDAVRAGTARRIIKPGQVFNRIHVDDLASVLAAAVTGRGGHEIYNVADDEPAPPQDVIAWAATLLGLPVPPAVPIEEAHLKPMAASFYSENKRVRNARIKDDLGIRLTYPTYREGLAAILQATPSV
jgi:nucleoside-diphosphate-sugar epimerase